MLQGAHGKQAPRRGTRPPAPARTQQYNWPPAGQLQGSNHNHTQRQLALKPSPRSEVVRWLGKKAEGLGVDMFPGYAASHLLYDGEVGEGVAGGATGGFTVLQWRCVCACVVCEQCASKLPACSCPHHPAPAVGGLHAGSELAYVPRLHALHVHTHTHTHTHTRTYAHACNPPPSPPPHTRTRTCTHTHTQTHTRACTTAGRGCRRGHQRLWRQ